ncbi:Tyrosine protein kinase (plasmid) [Cupriavidus taiwanensis]|uniref:Tyrosine protein kinase n=2 Tax=Cupriavidus taiwanensis TaxID=164546 RepID=A0A375INY8_9BURK|nr:tyrosine protein kinase [Cupriavidus taiwanensis]SPA31901.1 tyrosine protein kinase [Cupriavidus taiwanensis]SPA49420.1 tyrosine protein kinase [Cupriavidus taiwanensis]SPK76344.1 Tyrosine protein kinase [Cupriavidus taiwanensis]
MSRMSFAGAVPVPDQVSPRSGANARMLLDHAGWIVAAGLTGAAIGWMAWLSTPDMYRAKSLVQLQTRDAAGRMAQPQLDLGMLKSRAVVGPVVERLHLDIEIRPLRAPLLGSLVNHFAEPGKLRGPWPAELGYAWGGERVAVERLNVPARLLNVPLTLEVLPDNGFRLSGPEAQLEGRAGQVAEAGGISMLVGRIEARPGTRFLVTRRDLTLTVDGVARELRVDSESSDATTLRISWQNRDPATAAALVNGIADSYIKGQADQRQDDTAATLAFLSGELPRVKAELERAESALTRYRSRSGSLAPSQDVQSYLNGSMEYQRQIALLRLERTKLLQRFTTEANEVRTVDSQILQLTRERQEMDARMQNLSASERESVALTRDVKVAEDMYMTLRNKVEQLSLAQLDRTGQVRIVDNALTPTVPVGMGPWTPAAGGGVLGMLLAAGALTLRQRVRPTVATANDAEDKLGITMLGDIAFSREQAALERMVSAKALLGVAAGYAAPPSARLERPRPSSAVIDVAALEDDSAERMLRLGLHDQFLLARNAPHSLAVEGLRNVRAAVHFALRSAPDHVIAVTSPAPGAGKTFASVNLAVLFAEAGQRVLLIDADLRRGRVASWFDQPAESGLAELLTGRVPLSAAVRPTVVNGLSILPAGLPPPNPSELLMRPGMAEALRQCAARFDLVLIDTPPVLAVADASLVANLAGSTLVVLRADATLPGQVDETLKRLQRADARLLGGILNCVIAKRSNRAEFHSVNPYLGMPATAPISRRIGQALHREEKKE